MVRPRARPWRLAVILLISVLTTAGVACKSSPDPAPPPPNPGPVTDPNAITVAAPQNCASDSKGVLHVMNSYGIPLEIRMARGTGPGVRLAPAPAGGTDVTVEGPADRTARYDVVNPRGRYPGQRLVSVNWRRRSSAGPGTSRTIFMDLRCTKTSGS
jgi:hypothetical protein